MFLRNLRFFGFRKRFPLQKSIDSIQCIFHDHLIFPCISHLGQGHRKNRSDDNVKDQIQQKFRIRSSFCKQKGGGNQCRKHCIDQRRERHHRNSQIFGISNRPFFILLDRITEPFERKNRLTEGLHHRNSSHILNRFAGHFLQCVLIFPHFILHILSHHGTHGHESESCRDQAHQAQSPIKHQQ